MTPELRIRIESWLGLSSVTESERMSDSYLKACLDEIDRLNSELASLAAEFCPHIGHNEHGNKYCLIVNRTLPTTAVADGIRGLGEK